MIYLVIMVFGFVVAYANGANDNFKGVATLFGSGTTNYRKALIWATSTTFLGSIAACLLAGNLIKAFGGKGLIEDVFVTQPAFAAAVACGAGLTVLIATRVGMPISTTHSLVGALLGTGLVTGSSINLVNLGTKFFIPLMISPLLAIAATALIYPLLRLARQRMGITREMCLCAGQETLEVVSGNASSLALERANQLTLELGTTVTCKSRYHGDVFGLSAGRLLDQLHFCSSGVVSFARGLNDTPKIAAMLLLAPAFGASSQGIYLSLGVVGLVIALGGWLSARKVAETMSQKITTMNHGQGFTANVMTGLIVIGASRMGLPVSTTHVSCGALFGIGATNGGASKKTILSILLAWLVTLPLAAGIAAVAYPMFHAWLSV